MCVVSSVYNRLQAVSLAFDQRSCEQAQSASKQKLGEVEVSKCKAEFRLLALCAHSQDL